MLHGFIFTAVVSSTRRSVHEHVRRHIAPPPASHAGATTAGVMRMPLDHFAAATDERTFGCHFWVDETSYTRGDARAPVFLSMGGEGAAGPAGGQISELAAKHGALVVAIEHRYFGDSVPTADFSTANLRWLGTEQALADAAALAQQLNANYSLSPGTNRWVTFGGSYSGELAAWARLKYPHLFYGAVASSAPVTASIDFAGYDPIVAASLRNPLVGGSAACAEMAAQGYAALEAKMEDGAAGGGRATLASTFRVCDAVVAEGDCYQLHDFVSDDFMGLVQYNNAGAGRNIGTVCATLLNPATGADPYARLVNLTLARLPPGGCVYDTDGSGVGDSISYAKHNAGYADAANAGRAWPYMQCADGSGHMQTCNASLGCIFSPKYAALRFFSGGAESTCAVAFGVSAAQTRAAVAFNSANYGDASPGGSRIVFVNGKIDPFHWGGVLANSTDALARDVVALLVDDGSHCQDMGFSRASDSDSMKGVKLAKAAWVAKWVAEP